MGYSTKRTILYCTCLNDYLDKKSLIIYQFNHCLEQNILITGDIITIISVFVSPQKLLSQNRVLITQTKKLVLFYAIQSASTLRLCRIMYNAINEPVRYHKVQRKDMKRKRKFSTMK